MVDLPLARFKAKVDPSAGGTLMHPFPAFCYCSQAEKESKVACGCHPFPLWQDDVILPPGVAQSATAGTLGRIGVRLDEACPPGTIKRQNEERAECTFAAGDYVLF